MKIAQYFDRLNVEVQQIYSSTMTDEAQKIAAIHAFVCDLNEFSMLVDDVDERSLLQVVCSQFEYSALEMTFGLYRQSFSSLRRAFETALAVIYFSLNKLEHFEWKNELGDINWHSIIDPDSGSLSVRAAKALWPDMREQVLDANGRARILYRRLSQFVHGNKETWDISGLKISKNQPLIDSYFEYFREAEELLCIGLSMRYISCWHQDKIDHVHALVDRISHIAPVREKIGGPKEL